MFHLSNEYATCDGKIIKIPRREFIFRTCEDRGGLALDPS